MTVALYRHPDCALHDMGPGQPEQPARMAAIGDALCAAGLDDLLVHREAPLVERADLLRAHPAAYIDTLVESAPASGSVELNGDTSLNPYSLDAARRAAGAAVAAVDAVLAGEIDRAFCCVRPPGHHAERTASMGFCLFGNVALAALHALDVGGVERVAICDFDVHHGNGTEDIVAGDSRILFCSTFQYPLYPGYYGADVPGQRVNCPLPAWTDGAGFREAITDRWLPALEAFEPELILVSAGFDAHKADPLAGLRLVETDFRWVTERLAEIAGRFAGGRIVSVLEGGYDLDALGRSAAAHVRALMDS